MSYSISPQGEIMVTDDNKSNGQIYEADYRAYLLKELETEIEKHLKQEFSKSFKVVISADAEVLTDEKVTVEEKAQILRIVSSYLRDFDVRQIHDL